MEVQVQVEGTLKPCTFTWKRLILPPPKKKKFNLKKDSHNWQVCVLPLFSIVGSRLRGSKRSVIEHEGAIILWTCRME